MVRLAKTWDVETSFKEPAGKKSKWGLIVMKEGIQLLLANALET